MFSQTVIIANVAQRFAVSTLQTQTTQTLLTLGLQRFMLRHQTTVRGQADAQPPRTSPGAAGLGLPGESPLPQPRKSTTGVRVR